MNSTENGNVKSELEGRELKAIIKNVDSGSFYHTPEAFVWKDHEKMA